MREAPPAAATFLALVLASCAAGEHDEPGEPAAAREPVGVTRSLRLEVSSSKGPFRVENLAGTLTVLPGSGETIVAVATIHAGSEDLAALVTFDETPGEEGVTLLRVGYPVGEHTTYRYGKPEETGSNWVNLFGGGGSNTGFPYAGEQVRVSRSRGVPLWADVEVRLPAAELSVSFLNGVGPTLARGAAGDLKFVSYSGDQTFEDVTGPLSLELSSGKASVLRHKGSLTCELASGEIVVEDSEGSELGCSSLSGDLAVTRAAAETIRLESASGDISVAEASGKLLKISTASGDLHVDKARVENFEGGTASGDVWFSSSGESLKRAEISTANGDVTLLLGASAAFEARADVGHGRIENGFEDAQPIKEGETLLGYRRGDGRIRIDIRTVHGNVTIAPLK